MTLILGILCVQVALWFGRMYLPGFAGEFCGKLQGLTFTPFFMELSFVIFGFTAVFTINHFRRKWDGEELVYLEKVDDPEAPLSSDSRSVILPERAEKVPPLEVSLAAIEGALEMGDHAEARDLLSRIPLEHVNNPSVKELSVKLNS